jgi:hypothetical protein
MSVNQSRTLGMNLPRGVRGDRIEAALNIMREEEDRSMSKTILRIVVKAIADREPEFHEEVMAIAHTYSRGGEADE